MARRPDLEAMAVRVSDGTPVDWDECDRSAQTDEERLLVRNLRVVEGIARLQRDVNSFESTSTSGGGSATRTAPREWAGLEVREVVGEGAFGEVFRAWDPKLQREVALKLLRPASHAAGSHDTAVIREARLLAKIRHPNVVHVYGADTHGGRVGLWMEFVRGQSLEDSLREHGRFGARETALVGIDLCRALAAVHAAGLVHRDVKTSNVMREEGGRILMMDLGAGVDIHDLSTPGQSLSGTPLYIAPEVYAGAAIGIRSDFYSLGVLLYHLVTASYPVEARSLAELKEKHTRRECRLLRDVRPDLPELFLRVVERALAWEPERRFATAGQMEQALAAMLGMAPSDEAHSEQRPVASPHEKSHGLAWPRWLGVTLGAAVLLAAAIVIGKIAITGREAKPAGARLTGASLDATGIEQAVPDVERGSDPGPVPGPEAATDRSQAGGENQVASSPEGADIYTIEAGLYRLRGDERRERLNSGARLALGDRLSLDFRASQTVYLYVINEDEQGRAYVLFPLPNVLLRNPLSPGTSHVLPGPAEAGGSSLYWVVNSAGGRERLLLLASPRRLDEFELELSALPRPAAGQLAMVIPERAKVPLRGIGGLAEGPRHASAGKIFELAERLAQPAERVAGVWLRQLELENPER